MGQVGGSVQGSKDVILPRSLVAGDLGATLVLLELLKAIPSHAWGNPRTVPSNVGRIL